MSWLSSLFGGGGEDPVAVQQRIAAQADMDRRNAASSQAAQTQSYIDYLNSLRADQAAKDAKFEAMDPTSLRTSAMNTVGGLFTPEFESAYVPGSVTDPLEAAVYGEQRSKADDYLNRLFKRGVITDTGKAAAAKNLDEQGARVRQQLQSISDTILGSERDKLTGIADRARGAASNLNVGQTFDISPYSSAFSNELGTFNTGLSDLFRSNVPGDLFDTSTLGSIAGGAQGAGNRPFDPNITPGAVSAAPSDETDPFAPKQPVKRTSTVF